MRTLPLTQFQSRLLQLAQRGSYCL